MSDQSQDAELSEGFSSGVGESPSRKWAGVQGPAQRAGRPGPCPISAEPLTTTTTVGSLPDLWERLRKYL